MLGSILSLLAGAFKAFNAIWAQFFSPAANLERVRTELASEKAAQDVAAATLTAEAKAIDAQPEKPAQTVADDLNRRFGRKP